MPVLKLWWLNMMKLRSYKTVVQMFAKHFHNTNNFNAVVATAEEYPHASVRRVTQMLMDLRVLDIDYKKDEVSYDEHRLNELLEYIIDEQD